MSYLVTDELWSVVEPLLPSVKARRFKYPGRRPVDNRVALSAILFVLKTGIPWEDVPHEMGCCGMTAWKKLHEWQEAGVWQKLHHVLLERLHQAHKLNWDRASIDSSSVRAVRGGQDTGPNPTDRAKRGSKHHALVDGNGIPLVVKVTAANRHDVTQIKALVEAIPPVQGKRGRPRRRPKKLLADRAYDSEPHRSWLRKRSITPKLAKRRTKHGSGLGKLRWVVERTFAWLHDDRKLRIRDERRTDTIQAFLSIAAALICFAKL
ncbi:MAG: IS5 family transposase [Proteobacteria bacterium]|nr:MAG: IS5 family transposase [Pseudomonadota bacterium]